jgi:Na+/H+ antiporter NhaC
MVKTKKNIKSKMSEKDSTYFLKIILFFILGTFWIRLLNVNIGPIHHMSLPLGLIIGIFFASHEHFQIDRKIEFAVLLTATFISFYLPVGITL